MDRTELIKVARGDQPADLLLTNARLVNVFSGEVYSTDIAIVGDRIAGLARGYQARETVDLGGRYVCPGFIDGHVHIESAFVPPAEYARAVVPRGTTSVISDPHEIANVLGVDGIRFMIESACQAPLDMYVMASSCVPATDLETAGARLSADDLAPLFASGEVHGLAEVMNYPGVVHADPGVMRKLDLAQGRPVDGHAPGLSGRALNAYVAAGIGSDHECTALEEAREKLRLGMYLMIREGTWAKNLSDLLPLVTAANARRCLVCADDCHADDLLLKGHIDYILRRAVGEGLDPVTAIRLATLNAAEYFGLKGRGAVAPGYRADLVVLDDLRRLNVVRVYKDGRLVAQDGRLLADIPAPPPPARALQTMHLRPLTPERFALPRGGAEVKVIEVLANQIVTGRGRATARVVSGLVEADVSRDLLKMAVVGRHREPDKIGLAFARGFGLRRGALASSVAHDSHNIVVIGASDAEMTLAANTVARLQGGQVAVAGERVLAALPLPIAGLMSDQPIERVAEQVEQVRAAARTLGCALGDPFMALAFLALPVIPPSS